jgi:hypothetical protein
MDPEDFIKTIYLGDRACKALLIESWNKRVAVQIDVISRLKANTDSWDFYTDEDIKDGWLVFSGVRAIQFVPSGPLPNDYVNDFSVTRLERSQGQTLYAFELSIGSVGEEGIGTEVLVTIEADDVHLEDPTRPGETIR